MLFTYAAIDYYVKASARLGFLITQEVFKSKGAGEGFRRFKLGDKEHFKVIKAHDLVTVQPFEGAANKTAMIIVKKGDVTTYPISYTVWSRKKGIGKIPADVTLEIVLPRLQKKKLIAQPIGSPTGSWQTISDSQKGLITVEGGNAYKAHQGADPQPYGVFLLDVKQVLSSNDLLIRNLFDAGKRKVQSVEERIESDLVFPAVRGSDIKRWGVNPGIFLLMVQDPHKKEPHPEFIMKKQYPLTFSYLLRFKNVLLSRGSKSIRELAERTAFYAMFGIGDYTLSRYKVVWKFMSNDMVAAVISQKKTAFGYKLIIPTKTVALIATDNEDEAHYLCAIINSTPVRDFIKSYSSAGRGFGSPSVMNHVGILKFDPKNRLHQRLSELSNTLHDLKLAENNPPSPPFAKGGIADIEKHEKEVDKAVCELFGIEKEI